MRILILLMIILLLSCGNKDIKLQNSKWINNDTTLEVDSSLNAKITFNLPHYEYEISYPLKYVTKDSLTFTDNYKDSVMIGGYLKVLNNSEAIFCNYKLHPNRSGIVDNFIYFQRDSKQIKKPNTTKIIFPKKLGRYVLEFPSSNIINDNSKDRLYKFQQKQLKVNSEINALEITTNDYKFYFENSDVEISEFKTGQDYSIISETNPDSLFVWRLNMNFFSHYKIYEYDSILVKNDAAYFFVGKLSNIIEQKIFDQY